jgi:hypothetical protein
MREFPNGGLRLSRSQDTEEKTETEPHLRSVPFPFDEPQSRAAKM